MNNLRHSLSNILQSELPGATSHLKMLPPGRLLKAPPTDKSRIKKSSVLLLLFQEKNVLKVCLIKRPMHMKYHAGQIALPGGQMEKGETAIETALRETSEEIGINKNAIEILGKLSSFYVEVSHFQIQPVVGWLNQVPQVTLCYAEVETVIYFPVLNFKPPYQTIQLETITGNLEVPCIKHQGEIIWGATAMILSEFYDVVKQVVT